MHDWFSGLDFALSSLRRFGPEGHECSGLVLLVMRCVFFDLRQAPDSQFLGVVLHMPAVD